jgi:short subunit dehydrogenase-like uncharacterized protein
VVYGAYGHTARFVIAELEDRGLVVALSGRDAAKLSELAGRDGSDLRVATVDDASSLDAALDGAAAVVNCAGPFAESAPALIKAAARAQIHYVDITAEAFVALETFERFAGGSGRRSLRRRPMRRLLRRPWRPRCERPL